MSNARDLIDKANTVREEGNFLEALKLTDEALVRTEEEGSSALFAETLSNRLLIFRHLYRNTKKRDFLLLAKFEAEAAVAVAESTGIKESLAVPYFNLAKAYEDLAQYPESVDFYRKALAAITTHPPKTHDRSGVKADFKIHLSVVEYLAGDKTAYSRLKLAIKELEDSNEKEVSDYNYYVWLSGAHLEVARILVHDDPTAAKNHLESAKKIISADSRLTLRRAQLEELLKSFS